MTPQMEPQGAWTAQGAQYHVAHHMSPPWSNCSSHVARECVQQLSHTAHHSKCKVDTVDSLQLCQRPSSPPTRSPLARLQQESCKGLTMDRGNPVSQCALCQNPQLAIPLLGCVTQQIGGYKYSSQQQAIASTTQSLCVPQVQTMHTHVAGSPKPIKQFNCTNAKGIPQLHVYNNMYIYIYIHMQTSQWGIHGNICHATQPV